MELHVGGYGGFTEAISYFSLVYPIGHYFTFYMVVGIFKVKKITKADVKLPS
ncbi:hypothetical protein P7H21_25040 [Paenibacillus larvae]|nr:hypothetical protein [Paenibacillus larvae]MDT2306560.1 hypothetical protein [Paenibacillus larvae]